MTLQRVIEQYNSFLSGFKPIIFIIGFALLYWLRQVIRGEPCSNQEKLDGKVAVITGGSGDIAKEVAQDLCRRGAKVYLGCRDVEKGEKVKQSIKESDSSATIEVIKLDLSSFASIRQFASDFLKKEKELHLLINNAGVMMCEFAKTEDDFEQHFQSNYLGHFLLTHLLLPTLRASAPARIINLTAIGYRLGAVDGLEAMLQVTKETYKGTEAYAYSKLAVVMFTRELAKRLEGTGVTVNCLHPGVCKTRALRFSPLGSGGIVQFALTPFTWFFMKSAKDGAQIVIHCATDPLLSAISGKYFAASKEQPFEELISDDIKWKELYERSALLTGIRGA